MPEIEIDGLNEVIDKLGRMPPALDKEIKDTMRDSLLMLHESVPGYPPQAVPPDVYRRTGTLGRSIGTSQGGGKMGKPTVYSIKGSGGNIQGRFGTNLSYAKYVIDPQRQAYMHKPGYKGRQGWWTMDTVKERAEPKIIRNWNKLIDMLKKRLGL